MLPSCSLMWSGIVASQHGEHNVRQSATRGIECSQHRQLPFSLPAAPCSHEIEVRMTAMATARLRQPAGSLLLAALLLLTAAMVGAEPTPPAEERRMKVFLDDREVGRHSFRFDEQDGTLRVRSEAAFEVRFAFVTFFRYEHEAEERWRAGCLVGLSSKTNENGTRFAVDSASNDGGLALQTKDGEHRVDEPCPWSFAYWTPSLRERELLVNPQDGAALAVDFEQLGSRTLRIGNRDLEVQAWELRGQQVAPDNGSDTEVSITLYYDQQDRWVGLDSDVGNGRTLRYRPAPDDITYPGS